MSDVIKLSITMLFVGKESDIGCFNNVCCHIYHESCLFTLFWYTCKWKDCRK